MWLYFATINLSAQPSVTPFAVSDQCKGRSKEIKAIVDADQRDHTNVLKWTRKEWKKIDERDKKRRERIAQIFADGCFKTADDYSNAALVFQHGTVPEHYFQTYLWASRAVELGQESAKQLMAMGLDRYLMNKGYKQIYASQATVSPNAPDCHCLWPVEESSTDEDRRKFDRKSLAEELRWVDELNQGKPSCRPAAICSIDAKPVARGSLPGVAW